MGSSTNAVNFFERIPREAQINQIERKLWTIFARNHCKRTRKSLRIKSKRNFLEFYWNISLQSSVRNILENLLKKFQTVDKNSIPLKNGVRDIPGRFLGEIPYRIPKRNSGRILEKTPQEFRKDNLENS